jgi:hypothetical protein
MRVARATIEIINEFAIGPLDAGQASRALQTVRSVLPRAPKAGRADDI